MEVEIEGCDSYLKRIWKGRDDDDAMREEEETMGFGLDSLNCIATFRAGPGGMIGTRWAKMRFGGTNGRVAEELPLLETAVVKKTNRAATSGYLQSDWIKPVAARQGATPQCGAGLVADRSNYSAKITHL
ncbi:hypothetical protein U1Q18_049293 [Sarracenia purpurea var. burkii]